MTSNIRHIADLAIVDLNGRIVLGQETALLRNTIRDLIGCGKTNIFLNMREVPYIDSSGIGELISAFVAAQRAGGTLKLFGLTRRVREVLQIVKLLTVLEIFESEEAALATFTRGESRAIELTARAG
jgi:anti-sigma B factor antagonist